ncbi:phosphate acyltransferase PlsX [Abyssicoccus albus]|uniref:Phosphate acyltransferase n=1 Tax=Abyssicoccus albus TaxID=1817405 RepID=A0A1Q1G1W1_9BACL|nr:phosphate acyltransferase PlsX [Abyssicoccus albus]AQL56334.1 phosphate acyltransferase [Abyssicoccus albus]RPF57836.1 phosphate:acyl-[acyl carrier protein] acyltransferase [Abyssicoccus albus]
MKIAIDLMGGDNAPDVTKVAVNKFVKDYNDVEILVFGHQDHNDFDHERIEFIHCEDVVTMEDDPVRSVKRKKDSSMMQMIQYMKEHREVAGLSAGSTGALMSGGLFILGRIPTIERPALANMLPTKSTKGFFFLDIGANSQNKPEHLVQYAKMGSIYMEKMNGISAPTVGLLNIGTEEKKGTDLTKETHQRLKETDLNYIGYVESRSILKDSADVVVTDGFTGNMVLKSIEGTASFMMDVIKESMMQNIIRKFSALSLKHAFKDVKKTLDYTEYGGAILLGLDGTLVKAHGSSNEKAIYSGLRQCYQLTQNEVTQKIKYSILEGSDE